MVRRSGSAARRGGARTVREVLQALVLNLELQGVHEELGVVLCSAGGRGGAGARVSDGSSWCAHTMLVSRAFARRGPVGMPGRRVRRADDRHRRWMAASNTGILVSPRETHQDLNLRDVDGAHDG